MIVLKHLSKEFTFNPYKLRQLLRKEFPAPKVKGAYRTWKWEDPNDPELQAIRAFLKTYKGPKNA